ncbi:hypothetical protein OROGR_006104 [Orobanche gracilis]
MEEGLIQLNKDQLLRLSEIIHDQEFDQIRQIPFDSEPERIRHFDACNNNHETVKQILNSTPDPKLDERLYEVWHIIWEVLKGAINFGLQAVRSYSVRVEFLDKVVAHSDESFGMLQKTLPEDEAAVRRITMDAQKFKEAIDQFNKNHGSMVSKVFSTDLQDRGIGYRQLVEEYMEKRGIPGAFEDLSPEEKFMLSQEIVIDSGRGSQVIDDAFASARKELVAGFALLAFVATITVFDIMLDPTTPVMVRLIKTLKDFAASVTGSTLGHMAETAMKGTAWAELLTAECCIDIFAVAGFVIGVGIGIVLGVLGEFLIDAIFSSGGKHHMSGAAAAPAYFGELPDGESLARDIYNN